MKPEPVLIAALSGRALAASAKRAGYRPLVVDCFGDVDLCCAARDARCLPAGMRVGLRGAALIKALEALQAASPVPARGLILGTGFEDRPSLIARLGQRFDILGNDAETVAAVNDPEIFFPLLEKLGINHPETRSLETRSQDTQSLAPKHYEGWLIKRIGGSGGLHIRPCARASQMPTRHYFQRQVKGQAISVLGVVGNGGSAFALSRQWCAPSKPTPFRYGGAVSSIELKSEQEGELLEAALAITEAAHLVGLVSIDFMVTDEAILCLEVNPRPGATLDVHDDEQGSLFEAHLIACAGGDPATFLQENWAAQAANASAVFYADRGRLKIDTVHWPDWVSDRPQPGATIARGQPLAGVHAQGKTAEAAEQLCRERLAGLEKMLYDSAKGKELSA